MVEEDDLGLVETLAERFDRRALGGLERQDGVARLEHGGRWQVDLLAGFDLDLVERGDRDLRAVDEQSRLVAVLEVDDDPLLLQHLDGVLHRGQRLDRLGPVDSVVTGEGVDHPPDDEHRAARDHETGDQEPTVEPPARRWLGRGRVVDERHDSMMPAHNPTHPPDSVSRSW